MKNAFLRISCFFFIVLLGCEKEVVGVPTIIVQSPQAGLSILVPDTLEIIATVSDPNLKNISVTLLNNDFIPVGIAINVPVTGTTTTFNIEYPIYDVDLPNGRYHLRIRATNAGNYGSDWIAVNIRQAPLVRQGIVVSYGQNFNLSTAYLTDSGGLNTLHVGNADHRATLASNRPPTGFLVPFTNGPLLGFDLQTAQMRFSAPQQTSGGAPTFTASAVVLQHLWVGFFDGKIVRYGNAGQQERLIFLPQNERALQLAGNSVFLVVAGSIPGSGQTTLRVFNPTTGYQWHDVLLSGTVTALAIETPATALVGIINSSGQTVVARLNLQTGVLTSLITGIQEPVMKVIVYNTTNGILLRPSGVYGFQLNGSNTTSLLYAGPVADLQYDLAASVLWLATGNELKTMPITGGAATSRYTLPANLLGFDLHYNR